MAYGRDLCPDRRESRRWYPFRAVDSQGQTVDFTFGNARPPSLLHFCRGTLSNPDNRPPHVFARDGLRSYAAAIRELQSEGHVGRHCRRSGDARHCNNRIESDHRHVKGRLRAMHGPRTMATAWAVIQGNRSGGRRYARNRYSALPGRTCRGRPGFSARCWASSNRFRSRRCRSTPQLRRRNTSPRRSSGTSCGSMPQSLGSRCWRPTICTAAALGYANRPNTGN